MTNVRPMKKAWLLSLCSLVLCFSMLVGTTFAWFTDSVTSAGNVIQTGTLNVAMQWAEGTKDPSDAATAWTDASTGAIFKSDKWEPGYTEAKHLKITNEGTLALKYELAIIPNGEVSELADVIDVYYTTPATQLEERSVSGVKVGTLAEIIKNGIASGSLLEDEVYNATIVFKMRESAGNEYQNLSIGTDFSIQLLATQFSSEEDSFGSDYDAGVMYVGGAIYATDGDEVTLIEVTDDFIGSALYIAEGCTTIGSYAFSGNTAVQTVVLPSTVKTVDDYAFSQSSASTIVLNEGLEQIGNRAFQKNANLTSVTLPSTLKTIEPYAFQQTGLTEITIPESVETIGQAAFAYNDSLETIIINGSPVLGDGTGEKNEALNYVARACANLTSVYILGDPTYATTGITFSNTEGGVSDKITVYVTSDAAAAAYEAASTSCTNYTLVVVDAVDTESEDIDTVLTMAEAGSTIYLPAGEYTLTKTNQLAENLTVICAEGVTVKVDDTWSGSYKGNLAGNGMTLINATVDDIVASNVSFVDCTFPYGFTGSEGNLNLSLTNCTVNGKLHFVENQADSTTTVTNTTADEAEYYSAGTVEFVGCTIGTLAPVNTNTVVTGCTIDEYNLENQGAYTLLIDGVYTVGNADMLSASLKAGAKEITIVSNITLAGGLTASNVIFTGATADAGIDFAGHNITGSGSITYDGLNLTTVSLPDDGTNGERYGWYGGIDYAGHSVANYKNCTISGVFTLYSDTVNVEGCTFDYYVQDGDEFYNLFVYGADIVNVTKSTFTYGDRAVKIYTEGASAAPVVTITDCEFVAIEDAVINKALIEIDAYAGPVTLNYSGFTVDEALTDVATYNIKGTKSVTINGLGIVTLTPSTWSSTAFASNTIYNLSGDFNGELVNLQFGVNGLENVVIDGSNATNIKELLVTANTNIVDGYSMEADHTITGSVKITGFTGATQLSVFAYDTNVEICNNKAACLYVLARNVNINIHDNEIDAESQKFTVHNPSTLGEYAWPDYAVTLNICEYDLKFDRNTLTNSYSHALGINGYEATYATQNGRNVISSFTGNNITVNATVKTARAAIKIWADVVYAPQNSDHTVVNEASQALIDMILKEESNNTFTVKEGYDHTIFCIYEASVNK